MNEDIDSLKKRIKELEEENARLKEIHESDVKSLELILKKFNGE